MKATRTINKNQNGKSITTTATVEICTRDIVTYADGYNIKTGTETYEKKEITISVDGKVMVSDNNTPDIITKQNYSHSYTELVKKGAYARISNSYVGKESYDEIMNMIAECKAELEAVKDEEYTAAKAIETEKEIAETEELETRAIAHAKQIKNGLCPHCGTYCYGDCQAN